MKLKQNISLVSLCLFVYFLSNLFLLSKCLFEEVLIFVKNGLAIQIERAWYKKNKKNIDVAALLKQGC